MHSLTLFLLSTALALVAADGEYYVPRAYYTIDAEGHASAPVALRRLRRFAYSNQGGQASASASASSQASSSGGGTANADASSQAISNSYPGYPGGTSSASAKAEANANSNSYHGGNWRHNVPPPGYPFATGLLDYNHYANAHEAGQSGTFFNAAAPPRGVFSSSSSSMDSEGHVRFDQRSGITH